MLKGLVWYCSLAEDSAVTEAALWTLEATWKTKRDNPGLSGIVTVLETLPPRELWERALRWRERDVLIGDELILKTAATLGISEQEVRDRKLLFEPAPARESVEETMEAFDAAAARLKRQGSPDPAAA